MLVFLLLEMVELVLELELVVRPLEDLRSGIQMVVALPECSEFVTDILYSSCMSKLSFSLLHLQ